MSTLVELDINGGKQKVKIFSLKGCHLLAMFSRTKVAKEFRKWMLDVLENQSPPTLEGSVIITKPQQRELFTLMTNKSEPSGKPRAYFWSRFQNHFKLNSYKNLPADQFEEAVAYLGQLEGSDDQAFVTISRQELDTLKNQGTQLGIDFRVNSVLDQRFLVVTCNGATVIRPIDPMAVILIREKIRENINDVIPGYRIVSDRLYRLMEALREEVESAAQ